MHPEGHNCVMIAAMEGPHTLQKIGQIYGLTRMRICQIEKNIFEKIRKMT
jgi:DNA-directed RNA polymerase sigma subunit (sigma70/sigma32)